MGVEGLNSQILLCGPLCHTIYVWLDLSRRLGGGGGGGGGTANTTSWLTFGTLIMLQAVKCSVTVLCMMPIKTM